jgi:hypothetical protein
MTSTMRVSTTVLKLEMRMIASWLGEPGRGQMPVRTAMRVTVHTPPVLMRKLVDMGTIHRQSLRLRPTHRGEVGGPGLLDDKGILCWVGHSSGGNPGLGLLQLIESINLDFAGGHPGEHLVRLPYPLHAGHDC